MNSTKSELSLSCWFEKTYRMSLSLIEVANEDISIVKHIPIDLTNSRANVKCIKESLRDEQFFKDPVILNSQFKEILDSKSTRGDLYWSRINKFYVIERENWDKFLEINEVKIKHRQVRNISSANPAARSYNKPIIYNFKDRPVSSYFNVQSRSFRKELNLIKIHNNEILIAKELLFDLTDETANLENLIETIEKNFKISDPIILDCKFSEITDSAKTRGESYWNTKNKIYFINRKEWKDYDELLPSKNSGIVKYRKINHPITYDYKERPPMLYFPVTGPRFFRKAIQWIKIKSGEIIIYKDVPFDLNDLTANVPDITQIIKDQLQLSDPVLLEQRFRYSNCVNYQEIKDSYKTRGELFWNSKRKFYIISREDWELVQHENKLHSLHSCEFNLKHLNIKYKTYFDKSRETYFRNIKNF